MPPLGCCCDIRVHGVKKCGITLQDSCTIITAICSKTAVAMALGRSQETIEQHKKKNKRTEAIFSA